MVQIVFPVPSSFDIKHPNLLSQDLLHMHTEAQVAFVSQNNTVVPE